jgi:hypothetical protein
MTPLELLNSNELPEWFEYPPVFVTIVNQGLIDFHPWHMLHREKAILRLNGLGQRFPELEILPFAIRTDSDFVACFERGHGNGVTVLKDFAQPRTSIRRFASFHEWVRSAIEDMLSFEPEGSIWTPLGS